MTLLTNWNIPDAIETVIASSLSHQEVSAKSVQDLFMGFCLFFFFSVTYSSLSPISVSLSLCFLSSFLCHLFLLFLFLTPHSFLSSSFPFSLLFLPPFLSVSRTVLSAGKMSHSQLPMESLINCMLEITDVKGKDNWQKEVK